MVIMVLEPEIRGVFWWFYGVFSCFGGLRRLVLSPSGFEDLGL